MSVVGVKSVRVFVRDVGSIISVEVVVRAVGVLEVVAVNFIISSRISSVMTCED